MITSKVFLYLSYVYLLINNNTNNNCNACLPMKFQCHLISINRIRAGIFRNILLILINIDKGF